MKKIYTLLAVVLMAMTLNAGNFGILVNGKTYYQGAPLYEKDYQGRDQYKASVSLNQGDKWCIYDADNKASFVIAMESGEGSAKGNFTEGAEAATCNVAGCYDFYIKLKWEDNSLWVQSGDNCNATGVDIGGNPDPGPGPDPQPGDNNAYWYWKGEVDQMPINNEMEGGIFWDGTSSVEVSDAAYLFVVYQVHGVPGVQYMTDGWLGFEVTHATMSNCGTCSNGNKLYLPAGNHTLYLYDNGDGTVELSREELPGKKLVGEGQGIENTVLGEKARKMIIEGQLRIVVGGKTYDMIGRELN